MEGGVWKAHVWKAVYGRYGRRIYRVDALKLVNIKAGVSTKAPLRVSSSFIPTVVM